jgi:hypothetical protein
MKRPMPDFTWYALESIRLGFKSPRCPFASVQAYPRYFQRLSLLGGLDAATSRTENEKTSETAKFAVSVKKSLRA